MTKAAAIHQFFSGFGLPAYESASVPQEAVLPYLTYESLTGAYDTLPQSLTVNLWYRTTSNVPPNQKVEQISAAIGHTGKRLQVDGGFVWLMRDSPWAFAAPDPDPTIKRRALNLTLRFFTVN